MIAAVAEFVLYMIFSMALSMNEASTSVLASMAIWLILLTLAAGFIAPICGALESLSERKDIGLKIFVPAVVAMAFGLALLIGVSQRMTPVPAATSYPRNNVR